MPDDPVVDPGRIAVTVPDTTAETDAPCWIVTETPGTTLTICVPRIVLIVPTVANVCPTPNQTIGPETPEVAVVVTTIFARETRAVPETETEPLTVTVPEISADPVSETTVVPAPAVTVPVTTTGKAVVDCPPTIHMICPVAETDGTAVVTDPPPPAGGLICDTNTGLVAKD